MRQPDLIHAWHPGAEPVTALASTSLDSGPLLQLAATYPYGDNRALVLTNLAQKINHDAYGAADFAVQRLMESDFVEPEQIEEPIPDDTEPETPPADEVLADGQLVLPMPPAQPTVTRRGVADLVTDFGPRPGNTTPPSLGVNMSG